MKKLISKLLVFIMLITLAVPAGLISQAAEMQKSGARAIYVVFDNSGSMYGPGNMAWSQATYAMEVFAAMMNYDNGDQMKIFPMHDVTTDGTGATSSITVSSISDIAQIHNMYTPQPLGTPYTQVNTAAKELAALLDSGGAALSEWRCVDQYGDCGTRVLFFKLQGLFQCVEIFGVEDCRKCGTVNGAVFLHSIFAHVTSVGHLFCQDNDIQTHKIKICYLYK